MQDGLRNLGVHYMYSSLKWFNEFSSWAVIIKYWFAAEFELDRYFVNLTTDLTLAKLKNCH